VHEPGIRRRHRTVGRVLGAHGRFQALMMLGGMTVLERVIRLDAHRAIW
jgi:hypothetical protein